MILKNKSFQNITENGTAGQPSLLTGTVLGIVGRLECLNPPYLAPFFDMHHVTVAMLVERTIMKKPIGNLTLS